MLRTTLIAVIAASFLAGSIGFVLGQANTPADAAASNRALVSELKKISKNTNLTVGELQALNRNIGESGGHTVRQYLDAICGNTNPASVTGSCY